MWDQVCCCDEMQAEKGPHLLWTCGSWFSEVLKYMPHFLNVLEVFGCARLWDLGCGC